MDGFFLRFFRAIPAPVQPEKLEQSDLEAARIIGKKNFYQKIAIRYCITSELGALVPHAGATGKSNEYLNKVELPDRRPPISLEAHGIAMVSNPGVALTAPVLREHCRALPQELNYLRKSRFGTWAKPHSIQELNDAVPDKAAPKP